MVAARYGAGRVLVPLAQQVMLSVIGTLVATLVIAAVERGPSSGPVPAIVSPELTSGGKFAARAEAELDTSVTEVPSLPLLPPVRAVWRALADATPAAGPADLANLQAGQQSPTDAAQAVRHVGHPEGKRRSAEASRSVLPPRRGDYIGLEAAAPETAEPAAIASEAGTGLWSSTTTLLSRTASYGNALLDHLLP